MANHDQKRGLVSRIVKGVAANGFGQIVTLMTSLITVPLAYRFWGASLYGEWLLLSAIPVYLTMSDLSFGTTAGSEMTMLVARGETHKALKVFQSAWILVTVVSVFIAALMLILVHVVDLRSALHLSILSNQEGMAIMTVLLLSVCLAQQGGLTDAIFKCSDRFAQGLFYSNLMRFFELIGFIVVLVAGGDPWNFALVSLIPRVFYYLAVFAYLRKKVPWIYLGWSHAEMKILKPMVGPAITFNAFNLGYATGLQGILVLIGNRVSPAAVALFNPLRTLTRILVQMASMVSITIWPELSKAVGASDFELARRIHRRASQLTFWAILPAQIGLLVLGPWLFKLWIGQSLSDYRVLFALVVSTLFTGIWTISSAVPMSMNRHQSSAIWFLASSLVSLGLAALWVGPMGAFGAALAIIVGEVMMMVFVVRRALQLLEDNPKTYLVQLVTPPADILAKLSSRMRPRTPLEEEVDNDRRT